MRSQYTISHDQNFQKMSANHALFTPLTLNLLAGVLIHNNIVISIINRIIATEQSSFVIESRDATEYWG